MEIKTRGQKVTQTIDLKDLFGKQIRDTNLKEKVGQFFIDKIRERTDKGLDINGEKFKPYSKEYKNSVEFKAARKTNNVNMTLSGDMLSSIDIVSISGSKITLGFNDHQEELKAHGHMTGGGKNNNLPVRKFFGVSEKEIKQAKTEFSEFIKDEKK